MFEKCVEKMLRLMMTSVEKLLSAVEKLLKFVDIIVEKLFECVKTLCGEHYICGKLWRQLLRNFGNAWRKLWNLVKTMWNIVENN